MFEDWNGMFIFLLNCEFWVLCAEIFKQGWSRIPSKSTKMIEHKNRPPPYADKKMCPWLRQEQNEAGLKRKYIYKQTLQRNYSDSLKKSHTITKMNNINMSSALSWSVNVRSKLPNIYFTLSPLLCWGV